MAEIKDLSTTDANNTGTAANAGFPENMAYSDVNNAARALEGMIARHFADSNGTLTTTGSSNAYLLTPNRTVAAYTAGDAYMIKASFTNTSAVTINVSSLGAKSIVKPSGDALAAGEITSGGIYAIIYDGTNFQMAGADDPENLTLTSLTVTGATALNGNTTIGDAASDTVTITADVASDLIPSADGTHDLGAVGSEWQDLFIDGTANIDSLVADTADIDAGTIDGTVIGGNSAAAITGTTITADTSLNIASDGATVTGIKDEDDMASDSATKLATQQSIKAYVDSQVTAQDLDFQADSGGALSVDLDSQTFTLTGGTGIDTSGSGQTVTFAIDSTVATLTGSQTLTNKTLTSPVLNTSVSGTAVLDEDNMASDSDTQLATQQSIKAYVDSQVTAQDLDFQADSGGALSIDLDSETLTFTGGTGIDTSGSGNAVTFAIDSTVATLTGSQTLTNKTLTSPDINTPDIDGGAIDGTTIGGSTPAAGTFTSVVATGLTVNTSDQLIVNHSADGGGIRIDSTNDTNTGSLRFGDTSDNYIGAVEYNHSTNVLSLYADNATRMSVSSTGIDVTGSTSTDGLLSTGAITVDHTDGTDNISLTPTSTGGVVNVRNGSGTSVIALDGRNGQVGIDVTGSVTADGLDLGATTDAASVSTTASDYQLQLGAANSTTGDIGQNISFDSSGTTTASINSYDAGASSATGLAFFTGTSSTLRRFLDIGSNGDISFYENTGTTPKLFWDASAESLGIGTSSINRKLEIAGNNNGGAKANYIRITDTDTSATAGNQQGGIEFYTSDSGNENVTASIENVYAGSGAGSELTFNTAPNGSSGVTEALRIDENQNLLAGTSNTTWQSQEGLRYFNGSSLILTRDSDEPLNINRLTNDGALVNFYKDGSIAGRIGVASGPVMYAVFNDTTSDNVAALKGGSRAILPSTNAGADKDGTMSLGGTGARFNSLYLSSAVRWYSGSTQKAYLTYSSSDNDVIHYANSGVGHQFWAGQNRAVDIDSSGNLLVGCTSFGSVSTEGCQLSNSGTAIFSNDSDVPLYLNRVIGSTGYTAVVSVYREDVQSGFIGASQGATPTFAAPSDIRLKNNVSDHESELTNLMALRPVRWDWKDETRGSGEGFVAQELEQTAWADFVSEGEDGYKIVSGLGAVETRLIKAIQEQQTLIETLQAEVAALKGE